MKKNKDFVIFAQCTQNNELYPVTCFQRKDGKWSDGMDYVDKNGKWFFHMLPNNFETLEKTNDWYFYFIEHNYSVFSSKEIHDTFKVMNKGNMTLEDIRHLVYD